MANLNCPKCGKQVTELQNIDASLAEKIRTIGGEDNFPSQACIDCFNELSATISKGSVVHAREKAKDQQKLMLWKSRVNLIKKARQLMNEKSFSEAAVQYEKYLKVLEVVFNAEPGKLTPEAFKDSARTQELTVVAGVYWDLMRIYDSSEKYGDRMKMSAIKLTEFLRFTPAYPDIIRKAEIFSKTAKNQNVVRSFLKQASDTKGRCFIATSAFESYVAPEVLVLQDWRDQVLLKSKSGRNFVRFYYLVSPVLAKILDQVPSLKAPVRFLLRKLIDRAVRH